MEDTKPSELSIDSGNESVNRIFLPQDQRLDEGQLLALWKEQDRYIDHLMLKLKKHSQQQQPDASRREHLLVVRLTTKEQELQELSNQIAELKAAQAPSTAAMRNALLDPAVNIVVQKLREELEVTKNKLQETQEELSAWKFTPDSVTGKRLMAKCRQLLQENEEIGKSISSGRTAKLEGELAMLRATCEDFKKNEAEMYDIVQELEDGMEGMQSTILFLQQQLKEAKDTIAAMEARKSETASEPPSTSDSNNKNDITKTNSSTLDLENDQDVKMEDQQTQLESDVEMTKWQEDNKEKLASPKTRTRRKTATPVKIASTKSPRRGRSAQKRIPTEEEIATTSNSRTKRHKTTGTKKNHPEDDPEEGGTEETAEDDEEEEEQ